MRVELLHNYSRKAHSDDQNDQLIIVIITGFCNRLGYLMLSKVRLGTLVRLDCIKLGNIVLGLVRLC